MLPFLDKKRISGAVILKRGKPAQEVAAEVEAPDSEMDPGLKQLAGDILAAIEHKSIIDLAKSLKTFVELGGEMPSPPDED